MARAPPRRTEDQTVGAVLAYVGTVDQAEKEGSCKAAAEPLRGKCAVIRRANQQQQPARSDSCLGPQPSHRPNRSKPQQTTPMVAADVRCGGCSRKGNAHICIGPVTVRTCVQSRQVLRHGRMHISHDGSRSRRGPRQTVDSFCRVLAASIGLCMSLSTFSSIDTCSLHKAEASLSCRFLPPPSPTSPVYKRICAAA